MSNSPNFQNESDAYANIQKRVLRHLRTAKVDDQILEIVKKAYLDALKSELLVLSRAENKRLLAYILESVLDDVTKKLDAG